MSPHEIGSAARLVQSAYEYVVSHHGRLYWLNQLRTGSILSYPILLVEYVKGPSLHIKHKDDSTLLTYAGIHCKI